MHIEAMARKVRIFMFCSALMLALLTTNQVFSAGVPVSRHELENSHYLYGATEGGLQPQDCGGRCQFRCSATAFPKPCKFFCNKCCAKCLCVPPGTYGNKQTCPCYNNWKTKRGGPKCP